MILVDAGPLIALLNPRDANHARCRAAARRLPAASLVSTWPCFVEAMYLLGSQGGFRYQAPLWDMVRRGRLRLHNLTTEEVERSRELMEKYQDTPMDLADATLIAVAESGGFREIFTLDSDFFVYRLADGSSLTVLP